MGKLDIEPVIHHFSHQHPLNLLNFQPQTSTPLSCSGCKLEASAGCWIYSCSTCNYILHKSCSQMPQNLNHPVDQNHTLVLLSSPIYSNGAFKCDACGRIGRGFCYHCKECQLDIHTLCAFMPSTIKHNTHHHDLSLCFSPPYHNKGFQCDICKGSGSNCWIYRCSSCGFDAHTSCTVAKMIQSSQVPSSPRPNESTQPKEQHLHLLSSRTLNPPSPGVSQPQAALQAQPWPMRIEPVQTQYDPVLGNGFQPFDRVINSNGGTVPTLAVPQYVQPGRTNRVGSDLIESVVQGMVDGIAQQAGQAVLQSFLGS